MAKKKKKDADERVDYGFETNSPSTLFPLNPEAKSNLEAMIGRGAFFSGGGVRVSDQLREELRDEGWVIIRIGGA
jgi:hypothetical protein